MFFVQITIYIDAKMYYNDGNKKEKIKRSYYERNRFEFILG